MSARWGRRVGPGVRRRRARQRGVTMVEFIAVAPVLTMMGLGIVQSGLMFFAKNQINHASFMAARAGTLEHAELAEVRQAYVRALVPLYGGGRDAAELAQAAARAEADVAAHTRIELLNPTRESFDDWNDPVLQNTIGEGRRVIPNRALAFKDPQQIKAGSGQSIQDANLIKLRVTHGYEPKVPIMKLVYAKYLQWLDPGDDGFHTQLLAEGRIPVVTNVTLQMQSDAKEPDDPVSMPGRGNEGNPQNPGDPPVTDREPPDCTTMGCTVEGPGGGGGGPGTGGPGDGGGPPCL